MKNKKKKLWLLTAAFALTTIAGAASLNGALAKAEGEIPAPVEPTAKVSIVDGASVRVVQTGDNAGAKNGLRFATYMDKQEYNALMADTKYTDVVFGVLIAPSTYNLTEETVFSTDAEKKLYDWATWDAENGKWVYTESEDTRIMNFQSNELYEASRYGKPSNLYFAGSIVDVKPTNLTREFQGIGYIGYQYNGTQYYKFTDKQVRSMTYTAQLAIASGDLGSGQSDWLQKNYVDSVTDTSASYTTAYYYDNDLDGVYEETVEATVTDKTIDDEVSLAETDKEGYIEVTKKSNVSGKVFANDQLSLARYYVKSDLGIVNTSKRQNNTIDFSAYVADGYTYSLVRVINKALETSTGWVKTQSVEEAVDVDMTNGTLDISALEGVYKVIATNGDETLAWTFEAYSTKNFGMWADKVSTARANLDTKRKDLQKHLTVVAASEMVATVDDVENTSITNGRSGNYYRINGLTTEWTQFTAFPVHSKAYYESLTGLGLTLEYDYYADMVVSDTNYQYPGVPSTNSKLNATANGWYTWSVSLDTIVEYWDCIINQDTSDTRWTQWNGGLLSLCTSVTNIRNLYIGNFRIAGSNTENAVALVNVTDTSKVTNGIFEFASVVSAGNLTVLNTLDNVYGVDWSLVTQYSNRTVALADDSVAVGNIEKRAYTLTAKVGDAVVYRRTVDFYDPADGIVWNDMTDAGLACMASNNGHGSNSSAPTLSSDSKVELVGGTDEGVPTGAPEGNYYKYTFSGSGTTLKILPQHTKEYYELFAEEGEYTWTFTVYANHPRWRAFGKSSQPYTLPYNKWANVGYGTDNVTTYTLANIIKYWDTMTSTSNLTNEWGGLYTVWDNFANAVVYAGNVTFTKVEANSAE